MIEVRLPTHLRNLAKVDGPIHLTVDGPVTRRRVLDALEEQFPVLKGTIRDHGSGRRRAFMRFFAEETDISHADPDDPLPDAVVSGDEPLLVVAAMAGG